MWKLAMIETPFYVFGDKDERTRLGTNCLPGQTLLPAGPDPLSSAFMNNFFDYMGALGGSNNGPVVENKIMGLDTTKK